MNRGTWRATVHGVEKSWRGLCNWAYSTLINPSFQYFIHRSIVVWVHKQNLLKIHGFDSTLPGHLVAIICHICAVIHHFMGNRRGKGGNSENLFLSSKIIVDDDFSHEIRRRLLLNRKVMTNLDSVLKSRDITTNRGLYSQGYGLPSGHVGLWELDHKEGRMPKNWCLQTVVLEKMPENPLVSKDIKTVNVKGDQPWIFTGRTNAVAEAPGFWSFDVTRWLCGKVPDPGKDRGQNEKRVSEGEMAGCHHRCNAYEPEQSRGDAGTGKLGVLQSMWSKRVRHDWVIGWLEDNNLSLSLSLYIYIYIYIYIHTHTHTHTHRHTHTHTHTHYLDKMIG